MKSSDLHRLARYALGFGAIGFALLSLWQTRRLAELTRTEEAIVQEWGMRDLGSGMEILMADNPAPALVNRAVYDFGDGATLLRTRPSLAPLAFLPGLLAIVALLTRPPAADEV